MAGIFRQGNLNLSNQTGQPRLEFTLFGDWDKTIKILQKIGPDVKECSIKAQTKVVTEIVKKVKMHLRKQDLGWAPLAERTKREKSEHGLDPRTLISHGDYYNAIEVWTKGNQHMVFGGVKKGRYGHTSDGSKSKLDIGQIAAIHEFSTGKRIPRRPLWNPTIQEMGGAKGIKKMYVNSLLYHLRMRGIPIKPFRNIF